MATFVKFQIQKNLSHYQKKLEILGMYSLIYSPFPVHGIDKAMGIPPSILPWLSLTGCLIGLTAAFLLQIWTNGIDYKNSIVWKTVYCITSICSCGI